MPRRTREQAKADAARAWEQWARNAPLDLLDYFDGFSQELHADRCGPHHNHQLGAHLEELEDGSYRVVLAFDIIDQTHPED